MDGSPLRIMQYAVLKAMEESKLRSKSDDAIQDEVGHRRVQ